MRIRGAILSQGLLEIRLEQNRICKNNTLKPGFDSSLSLKRNELPLNIREKRCREEIIVN